jgi:lipoprotein-releasing system ATP-binding protein
MSSLIVQNPVADWKLFAAANKILQQGSSLNLIAWSCKMHSQMREPAAISVASSLQPGQEPEVRPEASAVILVENLEKTYRTARGELTLFRNLDLRVEAGEMVAIVGQSGAGKSSLLHLLGALDAPTAGSVLVAGTDVARLAPRAAARFRNQAIGYVWQFHYLLPEFTALENVAMPLIARGMKIAEAERKAAAWLLTVGLEDRAGHRPGELSGGEQQRVALARALVNGPQILLADEPTGDLDEATSWRVFDLLTRLHHEHGLTSILVTHNLELAARCTRALRLEGGRLVALGSTSSKNEKISDSGIIA